jgi:hypothetical protein
MAGFWGGIRFCHEMSSGILILGVSRLTHGSVSNKKTATRVGRFLRSTGVAVGYGPRILGFLCLTRYAIPSCATLEGVCEILTLCRGKVGSRRGVGLSRRSGRGESTDSF